MVPVEEAAGYKPSGGGASTEGFLTPLDIQNRLRGYSLYLPVGWIDTKRYWDFIVGDLISSRRRVGASSSGVLECAPAGGGSAAMALICSRDGSARFVPKELLAR